MFKFRKKAWAGAVVGVALLSLTLGTATPALAATTARSAASAPAY